MRILKTASYKSATVKAPIPEADLGIKRDFAGMVINVENPAGTIRMGIDPDGDEWRIDMKYDYGFISKMVGEDGEGIDVYLGPDQEAEIAYVVHQVNPETEEYDEDKVMLGFASAEEAKEAYLDHYDDPAFFGDMDEVSMEDFKKAVEENDSSLISWDQDSESPVKWNKKDKRMLKTGN